MLETLEMRIKGHSDIIDNMLYATASERRMLLLSLDRDLTEWPRMAILLTTSLTPRDLASLVDSLGLS